MDILTASKEFYQLLLPLTQKAESSKHHVSQSTSLHTKDYTYTVLPPGTATTLAHFTGPMNKTTVFISKRGSAPVYHREESIELCVSMTESCGDETSMVTEDAPEEKETSGPLVSREYVDVGQSLSNERVFLTSSQQFYSGQSACTTLHSTTDEFESSLVPLTLDNARYICSLYALSCRHCSDGGPLPSVWVVCTCDKTRTVAMGCSLDAQRRLLFNYTIYEDAPIIETQSTDIPSPTSTSRRATQTHAYCEYVITTSSCAGTEDSVPGNISVEFLWKDPDQLVSSPPESSEGVLRISTSPGYKFSPVLLAFNEVNALLRLCKIAEGQEAWPSADDEEMAILEGSVSLNVESFLEEVSSPLSQPTEVTVISPTITSSGFEPRQDLDFAERLWMFAKDATSFEDLRQTFAAVFKSLLLGQVQPFLHRGNSSTLAGLLRQLLVCKDLTERQLLAAKFQGLLADSKILSCLVEIGIDKLKRDYCMCFIGADLATSDQLDRYFSYSSSSSLLDQCLSLSNLHCVVELNASAISFLTLPTAMLSSLTKTALEVYKERDFKGFTTTPVFSLPLPAFSDPLKSVISLCTSLRPKLWTLSQVTETAGSVVTLYVEQPLFQGSQNEEEDVMFYAYRAHCSAIRC